MSDRLPTPTLPTTTYSGALTDSRKWDAYLPRGGDIIVCTPPKSGTTWTQAILALLISGDPKVDANPSVNAPWFDIRMNDTNEVVARLEGQTCQRQVKTHTPLDGIPIWDELRYISVYRHPIDVHFSARKHIFNYKPEAAQAMGLSYESFPEDPRESFRIFLENENFEDLGSLKGVVTHYLRCLEREPRENLIRLHYADMTRDLAAHVERIAAHVGISLPHAVMETLVDAARFGNMKANADRFTLASGKGVWRDASGFFDSATSNKWEGVLTEDDLAAYDRTISELLSPAQRKWLEWGSI